MTIPRHYYSSTTVATTLSAAITAAQTTITVPESATNNGWPASFPFTLAIDYGLSTQEFVDVTSQGALNASIRTWNVTRGVDGSTAQAHNANAVVRHPIVARDLTEAGAHIYATAGVHGLTGNVVGDSDAQTLTNKTFPLLAVSGSLGAAVPSRFIGGTTNGPPTTGGPFLVGDWVVDTVVGTMFVCVSAGAVGVALWAQVGPAPPSFNSGPYFNLGGPTAQGSTSQNVAPGDHSHGTNSCAVRSTTAQSIPTGADTPLTYLAKDWDDGSWFNTTAGSNDRFSVPAGTFQVTATIRFAASAAAITAANTERALWLRANGAGTRMGTASGRTSFAGQVFDLSVTGHVRLAAAGYIQVMAWQASGAALLTDPVFGQRATCVQIG